MLPIADVTGRLTVIAADASVRVPLQRVGAMAIS